MKTVLVVDDEKSIRNTLKAFLKNDGYEVSVAEDSDEALEILKEKNVDVVVTDIILPRISGVDLLKAIKHISPDVQVIMMTGEPTVETATESLRMGAFDYLYKPITKNDVLKTVKNAAVVKQLSDENRNHREHLELMIQERTEELTKKHELLMAEIEERKQAEKELRESENRFRDMTLTMADWVWEIDQTGKYIYISESVENILGYSPEELIGKPPFELMPKKESVNVNKIFLDLISKSLPIKDLENWNLAKDGSKVSLLTNGVPVFDKNDQLIGYRGVDKDITLQKNLEAEKIKMNERLNQAQKMESIGTLAGGIAHDFNNILSSILGFTELALDSVEKGTDLEDDLQEVQTAGMRAKDLVQQILTFARKSDEAVKPIQVDIIAKEVLKFIKSSIPATIQINDKTNSDSFIMGSSTQIHQILMNLCTNAAQAMEEKGGILEINVNDIMLDRTAMPDLKSGEYIEIKIKDTGMGISPQHIHSIFDPYFTTKSVGEGTGMGLAVVHGIVENYGGRITVDSRIGKGSCFTIYLPITKKRKAHTNFKKEDLPFGNENILFVDDEAPITIMGGRILEQLGYTVTTKTSSVEALELFRSKPQEFDLIMTDMTMPNMTGEQLAAELMKIRPDIPVVLCTGYSKKISEESITGIGIKALLYKPVLKADLAKTVRKVLDESNNSFRI